jgi:formiminotetrahydrofolate cyclodeaminase
MCGIVNVEINAAAMKDLQARERMRAEVATLRAEAAALLDASVRAFAERLM